MIRSYSREMRGFSNCCRSIWRSVNLLSGKGPDDVLVVRLADRPEQKYQVNWSAIERVELFEELVLREAAQLVAGKQYEEAHEYYVFLHRRNPEFPGLSAARQSCLLSEARHWLDRNRAPQALVVLLELWEQNHDYPELPQVLGTAVDHMVAQYFAAGQDAAARELVEQLAARYPDHEVVVARRQLLVARAETFLQTAHVAMDEQRWRESHDAIQMSLSIWPDLTDSQRLAQELNTRYPLIRVGVRRPRRRVRRSGLGTNLVDAAPSQVDGGRHGIRTRRPRHEFAARSGCRGAGPPSGIVPQVCEYQR